MSDEIFREEITEAIKAHGAWKHRLTSAARNGETNLPVQEICRDDKCRFGKWLYTITPNERNRNHLEKVKTLHRDFHSKAGEVAQKIAEGNTPMATAILQSEAYNAKSKELASALMDWKRRG